MALDEFERWLEHEGGDAIRGGAIYFDPMAVIADASQDRGKVQDMVAHIIRTTPGYGRHFHE